MSSNFACKILHLARYWHDLQISVLSLSCIYRFLLLFIFNKKSDLVKNLNFDVHQMKKIIQSFVHWFKMFLQINSTSQGFEFQLNLSWTLWKQKNTPVLIFQSDRIRKSLGKRESVEKRVKMCRRFIKSISQLKS